MRKRNLSMAWILYKKAYDMVPHSWIIDCLETVGINEKIQRLLAESMKSWQVELISGEENLGEVNIRDEFFKVILCHHCYLWCVCYHLHIS